MDPAVGVPTFVTLFSSSPRTAIGVQTAQMLAAFPEHLHLYFAAPEHQSNSDRRMRLEHPLIARAGRLQRAPMQGLLARLGIGWWPGGRAGRRARRVIERIRPRVSVVYLAPLNRQDATRMRQVAELLRRPFVLHLWDSLSGVLADDPDLRWLLQHAARVLVLSEALQDDVLAEGVPAEILRFTRGPSSYRAVPPRGRPLRIALIGLIDPYVDGVARLDAALDVLERRGVAAEWVYVGPDRSIRRARRLIGRPLTATGFVDDDVRDRLLAQCQIGFLPGPSQSPEQDMRSRYSIPSRSLDFLAVGLPAVGVLHPSSAAARFATTLGLGRGLTCTTPEQLADAIERLGSASLWEEEQEAALAAFAETVRPHGPDRLKRVLADVQAASG